MILLLGGQAIAEMVSENFCRDMGSVWWDAGHHPLGVSVLHAFSCANWIRGLKEVLKWFSTLLHVGANLL